jgi:TolB protein
MAVLDGVGRFSASDGGTLVYRGTGLSFTRRLVWVDRQGRVEPLPSAPRFYRNPRLSPDDQFVATGIDDGPDRSIWVYDLREDLLSRLTFGGSSGWPTWTADGARVVYASNRPGTSWDLVSKPADGNGGEDVLFAGPDIQHAGSAARDGTLVFTHIDRNGWDIRVIRPGAAEPEGLLDSSADEQSPAISRDGQWVAYVSNESGRNEILVRPLADPNRWWQVSGDGGEEPVWARDGSELFFRNGAAMLAVAFRAGAASPFGKPALLFEGEFETDIPGTRAYDVSRDAKRFLMMQRAPAPPVRWHVIVNWQAELQRLLPR